jgi:hypothetical protein
MGARPEIRIENHLTFPPANCFPHYVEMAPAPSLKPFDFLFCYSIIFGRTPVKNKLKGYAGVKLNSFTHHRALLVLHDCGILAHATRVTGH